MNESRNDGQVLLTSRYDLNGCEIGRVTRMLLLHRMIPVGNLAGGGGLRCLIVLAILHILGRPLFKIMMRHEQKIHHLHTLLKRSRT